MDDDDRLYGRRGDEPGDGCDLALDLGANALATTTVDTQFAVSDADLAAVVFRLDHPYPGRPDHDVVDVRDRAGDLPVVEDDEPVSLKRRQPVSREALAFPAGRPTSNVLRQDVESLDRDEGSEDDDADAEQASTGWSGDRDRDPDGGDERATSKNRAAGGFDCSLVAIAPARELAIG
jgi:hypothetical protein